MTEARRYYLTTAIDYPNSRPHIGTAFEKIGADVQARYRRMEGYDVHFLMGNDENTIKVARRAAELGLDPKAYCDEMACQFREVWRALDVSNDDFIQTSEERHHVGCRKFIQKVYDNGYIYKGTYEGLYCEGCEEFKSESDIKDAGGVCPNHKVPPVRRSEPCYYFALSKLQDRLLKFYDENPDFIQPESRRNEVVNFVKQGLLDLNTTRTGQTWGIRVPFDEQYTIYVWFDALLNYATGVGYGTDDERFKKWWPADLHVIGKDITRFHCALWPAMCFAAGIEPPRHVFGHGFVYIDKEKIGKSTLKDPVLSKIVDPMELITKFSGEAFRYYFLRECPFPSDGDFSLQRFAEVYNSELPNNLGNMYSRVVKLVTANYDARLTETAGRRPESTTPGLDLSLFVEEVRGHVERCQYNVALQKIVQQYLTPANQYLEANAPWKLVKTDKVAASRVLFNAVEPLRVAAILLKPFLPLGTETIYRSFNFAMPWERVSYADAASAGEFKEDLRILAALGADGKVKPLYPRIE
jgi:methionyl-tRNA synthetase